MKAIITGGAGFIGSHVAAHLIEKGISVLVIDDLSGSIQENIPEGCEFKKASINDDLNDIFSDFQPDFVYHLAAYAAEGLSHHIPVFNYYNNVAGTANVMNASHKAGVKHFVFTSSIAAYGHPETAQLFDENTSCFPCDPYGSAKLACEHHIMSAQHYYQKMNYTIFRPHNVFGPKQNISDPYRNVVGIFMLRALENKPFPVFGNGEQTRSFSYIDVVAKSIALAPFVGAAKNEVINIGGDVAMSINELGRNIAAVMGVELQIERLPERKEVMHAHCSHAKAQKIFADVYTTENKSIEEGLQIMAQYVKSNPIPPVTECPCPIEIFDNLPQSWKARLS